jgi:hypothetical protein
MPSTAPLRRMTWKKPPEDITSATITVVPQ